MLKLTSPLSRSLYPLIDGLRRRRIAARGTLAPPGLAAIGTRSCLEAQLDIASRLEIACCGLSLPLLFSKPDFILIACTPLFGLPQEIWHRKRREGIIKLRRRRWRECEGRLKVRITRDL